jgi:hypothetical protein
MAMSFRRATPRARSRFVLPQSAPDEELIEGRLPARLIRRQSGGDRVALGHLQVRQDFVVQLPIEPRGPQKREHALDGSPCSHGLASRNRATSAVAFSHCFTASPSCFVPARVSA